MPSSFFFASVRMTGMWTNRGRTGRYQFSFVEGLGMFRMSLHFDNDFSRRNETPDDLAARLQ